MANSTQLITDITTVLTNGPNGATSASAMAASGVIMDYKGNVEVLLVKLADARNLANLILGDTDASDGANLGLLQGIVGSLS